MAAQLYYSPFLPAFSSNGLPVPGARLYFFYSGTDTLAPIYSDSSLTSRSVNPVTADLAARFDNIYLDGNIVYRVRLTDSNGVQLGDDTDPYYPGQAITITPSLPQLLAPDGSSKVGFKQRGTGAVNTNLEKKAQERVSVKDYGAVGDGVAIENDAFDKAIAALTPRGGTIFLPAGRYKTTKSFQVSDGISFEGTGSLSSVIVNAGTTDCLIYGTGTQGSDPDIERTGLKGFAIIGSPTSGKAFWGRKATTMFYLEDLYIESGNSPVVLDSCYSLMMTRVQVRSAESGDNIKLNSISHNVTLLHCTSQVAKAGAGVSMSGCYIPRIIGGNFEFNGRDQIYVGTGCRGVLISAVYVEGIQPSTTGYAGINVVDADTVTVHSGFFDATQNGPVGTNGTGTYIKAGPGSSRVRVMDYGFISVDPGQIHVHFMAGADNCEAIIPASATFINANPARNVVRPNAADDEPVVAVNSVGFSLTHNARNALTFSSEVRDPLNQWTGITYIPKYTGFHGLKGFVQVENLAVNSRCDMFLRDITDNVDVARIAGSPTTGSPSIPFDFAEILQAGHGYQIQLFLTDGAGTNRATSSSEISNRIAIERKF